VLRFAGRIEIIGINPYVRVSAARARALKPDWKRPLPVLVRINGEPAKKAWRINMMPMGNGDFYLYLHGSARTASNTKVGDRVKVEVAFDAAYRGGPAPMPAWFRAPLTKNAKAMRVWKALTPSRQKEMLRYLLNLKSAEARARNLKRTLGQLSKDRVLIRP
jgi:hypothetical protein